MALYKGNEDGDLQPITSNALDLTLLQEQIDELNNKVQTLQQQAPRDFIMVNMDYRQYTPDAANVAVDFNNIKYQNTDKLTFSGGGVIVGAGVKAVKVDLTLWTEVVTGYMAHNIRKNEDQEAYNLREASGSSPWGTQNASVVFSVAEGDVIKAYVRPSAANAGNNVAGSYSDSCNMIVEVVEYA